MDRAENTRNTRPKGETRNLATDAVTTAVLAGAGYYGVEGAKKLKEVVTGKKDADKKDA